MTGAWPRIAPLGDRGLVVEFPPEVSPETNALVRGADAVLAQLPGVVETVPTFRSVLVVYDPLAVAFDDLAQCAEAAARAARPSPADAGDVIDVPVVYGGPHGPDLDAAASAVGLSSAEVIRLHTATLYRVYMLGFSPGFPYLGLLPEALRLPRRATPRVRVPAGSVGIADAFTGIYPQDTAGGWHLLGRTPLRLFDPDRDAPCLMRPGDRVRFVPADGDTVIEPVPAPPAPPRRPAFKVREPGLMTTVQDLGRRGWRRFGVPSSGALDPGALEDANAAAGNDRGAAGIEFTFPGPRLEVLEDTLIAIAGADLGARLNRAEIGQGAPVRVRAGDVISFAAPGTGQWAYLAVACGIDAPLRLGSRAAYTRGGAGGLLGRPLRAGDILGMGETAPGRQPTPRQSAAAQSARVDPTPIRVVIGPQADAFTADALAAFFGSPHEITVHRDRSGVRLRGPALGHRGSADILSDGLLPGAVQVPADGGPLVILADGPTTGGYPKIAAVISADLDRLAQLRPGARIRFTPVSVAQAHALLRTEAAGKGPRS